jgi:cytochrome c-type biogenesis protein
VREADYSRGTSDVDDRAYPDVRPWCDRRDTGYVPYWFDDARRPHHRGSLDLDRQAGTSSGAVDAVVTPTVGLAFVAGVLSFLSPCVLPLVPSYLAYVGGTGGRSRRTSLRNAATFVAGFSTVFVALGASASALGALLRAYRDVLSVAGGVLVVVFGLILLGAFRLPFLMRTARFRGPTDAATPVGAFLLGTAFAAGWTPCIGPVLGGVLTLAGTQDTLAQGVLLLVAYSAGLAIPFLASALAFQPFLALSRKVGRSLPWIERGAGALLVVAGVAMVTGTYETVNTWLIRFTPDWLVSRL